MANSVASEVNGRSSHGQHRSLEPGIYVPTVAFFKEGEEVDIATTKKHATRLGNTGIKGIVTHGSNGEAVHLSHEERIAITRATREALDASGHREVRVVAGCGAHSTREVIRLCKDAAGSGAEFALVLPPSYYSSLLSSKQIMDHFRNVADASPIPLLIYNFPAVQSGLDLNSDIIIELAKHPNIVGVKLTCGNTGKLSRVAAATSELNFLTMGGSSDFLLQTLVAGGHGVIAGLANLSPKANVQTHQLYVDGKIKQAQAMQSVLAHGDWVAIKGGFVAVKVGLEKYFGYGGLPRQPTALPEKTAQAEIESGFAEMMDLEKSLQ